MNSLANGTARKSSAVICLLVLLQLASLDEARAVRGAAGPRGRVAVAGPHRAAVAGPRGAAVAGPRGVAVTGRPAVGRLPGGYIRALPAGYRRVVIAGTAYYLANGVYYQPEFYEGTTVYVVANP